MRKHAELLLGILAVAVVGAGAAIAWLLTHRKTVTLSKGNAPAAPTLAKKPCTPEDVEAGVQAAIAAGQADGQQGAAAGPHAAAGAAAAGVATSLGQFLSGPCGKEIEKRLRQQLNSSIRSVSEGASKALRAIDNSRRVAQDVTTLGPQRRAAVAAAKKAAKKARKALHL